MTHLYLIRHAEYQFTPDERPYERGLTARGEEQARRLAARLASGEIPTDVLISSTMTRARETAAILAPALGRPAIADADVEEWRNTDGHDLPWPDFLAQFNAASLDQRPFYFPVAGGETWARFMVRACTALNRIVQQHAGRTIAVVCHGGVIEASFHLFCGFSPLQFPAIGFAPAYTSITHWQRVAAQGRDLWVLERFNDTAHLRETGPGGGR